MVVQVRRKMCAANDSGTGKELDSSWHVHHVLRLHMAATSAAQWSSKSKRMIGGKRAER